MDKIKIQTPFIKLDQLLKYAEEAGASKLALDKLNAEAARLRAENQSLKMNVVKLETELGRK